VRGRSKAIAAITVMSKYIKQRKDQIKKESGGQKPQYKRGETEKPNE